MITRQGEMSRIVYFAGAEQREHAGPLQDGVRDGLRRQGLPQGALLPRPRPRHRRRLQAAQDLPRRVPRLPRPLRGVARGTYTLACDIGCVNYYDVLTQPFPLLLPGGQRPAEGGRDERGRHLRARAVPLLRGQRRQGVHALSTGESKAP